MAIGVSMSGILVMFCGAVPSGLSGEKPFPTKSAGSSRWLHLEEHLEKVVKGGFRNKVQTN
jgi:hypothetical protein